MFILGYVCACVRSTTLPQVNTQKHTLGLILPPGRAPWLMGTLAVIWILLYFTGKSELFLVNIKVLFKMLHCKGGIENTIPDSLRRHSY